MACGTAKQHGLKPKYGDADSIFLDNPKEEDARELILSIKKRFLDEIAAAAGTRALIVIRCPVRLE